MKRYLRSTSKHGDVSLTHAAMAAGHVRKTGRCASACHLLQNMDMQHNSNSPTWNKAFGGEFLYQAQFPVTSKWGRSSVLQTLYV